MLQDSLNVQMCLLYVFLPIKGTIKSKERDPKQAKFNKKRQYLIIYTLSPADVITCTVNANIIIKP